MIICYLQGNVQMGIGMKKIYIYILVCLSLGTLLFFKKEVRLLFSEDITQPTSEDEGWKPVLVRSFKQKMEMSLHFFSPMTARELMNMKLSRLDNLKSGISTLILAGTLRLPTNDYMRILSKRFWGVEEIRIHGTESINPYALINLIKSNFKTVKAVSIFGSKWEESVLSVIKKELPPEATLEIIDEEKK